MGFSEKTTVLLSQSKENLFGDLNLAQGFQSFVLYDSGKFSRTYILIIRFEVLLLTSTPSFSSNVEFENHTEHQILLATLIFTNSNFFVDFFVLCSKSTDLTKTDFRGRIQDKPEKPDLGKGEST